MSLQESINDKISNYKLLNQNVELCGKYFDVVPDGNLYTLDDYPIFAIRMRSMGISYIMETYKKKYNFVANVLTYKIHTNQYTLYTDNTIQMYITQRDLLLKFFDFADCKEGEFRSIIIVITNEDNRMIHAIPYIYGILDKRKKIIFLDPFFNLNLSSGCIVGAEFFYNNLDHEIDCYCHGDGVQADHHSCGIIACDFVKNCLKNNARITKKILKSVKMRTEIANDSNGLKTIVNVFDLPSELKKFSQLNASKLHNNNHDTKDYQFRQQNTPEHTWFEKHLRTLIYRRDPRPYDPEGSVIPSEEGCKKEINTALLEKGHHYAGKIVEELGQSINYNSKYWLSLIRGQKEGNIFVRLIRRLRAVFKKNK